MRDLGHLVQVVKELPREVCRLPHASEPDCQLVAEALEHAAHQIRILGMMRRDEPAVSSHPRLSRPPALHLLDGGRE